MTQITAYKVYTTGTSLAYCGVAGSAADAYVPSGTAICSDPFLQDQIATADGTDWQYVGENRSWTQPTMTGNQMTLGGSVWGIYESGGQTGNLWKISDKNGSTYWDAGRPSLPINVIFYNPNPVLATSVYFYNYSSDGINNYNFSGSNDNSTWTQLSSGTGKGHNQQWTDTITTSTPYKYFRLQVTQTLDSSGWLNLREVTISGTENVVADPVVSDLGSDSVRMFAVVPVTDYPYAHYEGTIYDIDDAPAGAFGITAEEKTELEDAVSDGGTLGWYSDQRPYVEKYVAWTQPVLTSDSTLTVLGTVTASASAYGTGLSSPEYPYRAMDGIKSGTSVAWWATNKSNSSGQWWQVKFPYQINITALTYYNRYESNSSADYRRVSGQFWTSSDRTTAIGDSFGPTANTNWTSTVISGIPAEGILTDTIYFYITSTGSYRGIGELEITATRRDVLYEVPQRYMMQLIPVKTTAHEVSLATILNPAESWKLRSSGVTTRLLRVDYSNGLYIIPGNSGVILTSRDGVVWNPRYSGVSTTLYSVVYGDGKWVMCGSSGVILTSTDAITWTPQTSGTTQNLYYMVYANNRFVAVGVNGTFVTSSDGVTWTVGDVGSTVTLEGVAYFNGMWIVDGANSTILTSTDLSTWVSRSSGTSEYLRQSMADSTKIIILGDNGTILVSTDGTTYTVTQAVTTSNLWDLTKIQGFWAVVSVTGEVLYSSDAINWTLTQSPVTSRLTGITTDDWQLVACGDSGVIETFTPFAPTVEPLLPVIAPAHPYAHYDGTIYDIADAPVGAYPLTDLQYYTINYYVNAGGTLAWYSNQRPYVTENGVTIYEVPLTNFVSQLQ